MKIEFNRVTWYSKLCAIILFLLLVPILCFYIGEKYGLLLANEQSPIVLTRVVYKNAVDPASVSKTTHTYSNAIYSFEYPSNWNATKNTYAPENTLFGIGATDTMGGGGIEIQTSQKSLDTVFASNSEFE